MADFQQQAAALKPDQIFEIIVRRRWLIIIPLCFSLTLGLFYTLTTPKTYKASTTILIQPQKVPTDYVQSIVTTDIGQRINTISQQILSRTNLEKIIKQFRLFHNKPDMYQEDKVQSLRRRVKVEQQGVSTKRPDTEAFSVSFTGSNPEVVMKVANTLATFFMDENLKARETQAIGTSEFLESELDKIKRKLEDREKALATYRAIHMGGLPDELETNLRTLDRLQIQQSQSSSALRETQNAISLLKSQISRLKENKNSGNLSSLNPDGSYAGTQTLPTTQQQYDLEKLQLNELLSRYTVKHPEVIKLTKSIARLEKSLDAENQDSEKEGKDNGSSGPDKTHAASSIDNVLFQYNLNLKQMENEIVTLQASLQKIKATMLVYQKKVEDTPKRELELQSIQRDYQNIRKSYNSLLARRLEAELAVNMEKKQKGEQFRIIDHARLPEKPTSPDTRMLFMLSLVIGCGIGGGIIFLLEFLNPVIRNEGQIETEIGLPTLASIPILVQPKDNRNKWIQNIVFTIVSLYATTVLSFFAFLNFNGIDKTLNLIKIYINY